MFSELAWAEMLRQGASLGEIGELSGHHNPQTTKICTAYLHWVVYGLQTVADLVLNQEHSSQAPSAGCHNTTTSAPELLVLKHRWQCSKVELGGDTSGTH